MVEERPVKKASASEGAHAAENFCLNVWMNYYEKSELWHGAQLKQM